MRPPSALEQYQLLSTDLMVENAEKHGGCAVLLKPGLGKTVVALTAVLRLGKPLTLVVAPAQVVKSHVWSIEAMAWEHTCGLRVVELDGNEEERSIQLMLGADIFVVSYQNLLSLTNELGMGRCPFECIIYDELSKMKHPGTKHFKRMRAWAKNVPNRFGLTGSPMGNHWKDLWGELFIVCGAKPLGPTQEQYLDTYFKQIPGTYKYELRTDGSADIIRSRIKPYAFSINAKLAADKLPKLIETSVSLKLPRECLEIEKKLRQEFEVEMASGRTLTALNQSKLATSIRQLASGAVYTGEDGDRNIWDETHSLKTDALKEIQDEAQGAPILVFIWFDHERQRLMRDFPGARLLDGSAKMVAEWNAKKIPIMLAHPQGSGLGLNLQHGGSLIVWYTLPWSRELYDQGNGREARKGQPDPYVSAIALLAGGIDRLVWGALARKGDDEASVMESVAIEV